MLLGCYVTMVRLIEPGFFVAQERLIRMQSNFFRHRHRVLSYASSPQFTTRTGVIAGQSVEDCLRNQDYWKKEFYTWYNKVVEAGRVPTGM